MTTTQILIGFAVLWLIRDLMVVIVREVHCLFQPDQYKDPKEDPLSIDITSKTQKENHVNKGLSNKPSTLRIPQLTIKLLGWGFNSICKLFRLRE